jgi:hypothetical protein
MAKSILFNTDNEFRYGNCVITALSRALNIEHRPLILLLKAFGIESPQQGLDFYQIKRFLNFICVNNPPYTPIKYFPNTYKLTYLKLIAANTDRSILTHFPGHLSFAKNATIFDGYFDMKDVRTMKPTGWWILDRSTQTLPLIS